MKLKCMAVAFLGMATFAQAATEKPNILFIFADDQMWNSVGYLDDSPVKTPNLDRLRERGASFTHAYNMGSFTSGVCVASRTMLNTGSFVWRAVLRWAINSMIRIDRRTWRPTRFRSASRKGIGRNG
jgi:choline-sulfatase